MAGRLQGKAAVVTGSGQSVGRSIALLLAAEGASVVVNSRSPVSPDGTPTAADTVKTITEAGGKAIAVFADVSTMEGGRKLVDACLESYGSIDILVNNAGQDPVYPVDTMTEAQWDHIIDVNLKSQYICAHFAAPHMKQKRWGRIINASSRAGLYGMPAMTAYSAAKAGTIGFTYALALELSDAGITVNCFVPRANTVRSERSRQDMLAATGKSMFAESPNRTPDHVAPAVVYLATDEAAGITGQVFFTSAGAITLYAGTQPVTTLVKQGIWSLDELDKSFPNAFGANLAPLRPPPAPE